MSSWSSLRRPPSFRRSSPSHVLLGRSVRSLPSAPSHRHCRRSPRSRTARSSSIAAAQQSKRTPCQRPATESCRCPPPSHRACRFPLPCRRGGEDGRRWRQCRGCGQSVLGRAEAGNHGGSGTWPWRKRPARGAGEGREGCLVARSGPL